MMVPLRCCFHHACGMLGTEKIAYKVDLNHQPPLFGGELVDRLGCQDAGIGNQYIKAPELLNRAVHHVLDLPFVGHVHLGGDGSLARLGDDIGCRLLCPLQVQVRDHHVGTFVSQAEADRFAEPSSAASDDGDPVL